MEKTAKLKTFDGLKHLLTSLAHDHGLEVEQNERTGRINLRDPRLNGSKTGRTPSRNPRISQPPTTGDGRNAGTLSARDALRAAHKEADRVFRKPARPKAETTIGPIDDRSNGELAGVYDEEADLIVRRKYPAAIARIKERLTTYPDTHKDQLSLALMLLQNGTQRDDGRKSSDRIFPDVRRTLLHRAEALLRDQIVGKTEVEEHHKWIEQEEKPAGRDSTGLVEQIAAAEAAIRAGELDKAAATIGEVIRNSDESSKVRRQLLTAHNHLMGQINLDAMVSAKLTRHSSDRRKTLIDSVLDSLSEALLACESFEQREERILKLDVKPVELPTTISRMTVVENARIVVSVTSTADIATMYRAGAELLAGSVFLIRCRLIGVPNEATDQFQRVENYSIRKFEAVPCNLPMRRPDSDATWYPLIMLPVNADYASFPDSIPRSMLVSTNIETNSAISRVRIEQQRAVRMAFEQVHAERYVALARAQDRAFAANERVVGLGKELRAVLGDRKLTAEVIKVFVATKRASDLHGIVEWDKRLSINNQWKHERQRLLAMCAARIEAQAASKIARAEVSRLEAELHDSRMQVVRPSYERMMQRYLRNRPKK